MGEESGTSCPGIPRDFDIFQAWQKSIPKVVSFYDLVRSLFPVFQFVSGKIMLFEPRDSVYNF